MRAVLRSLKRTSCHRLTGAGRGSTIHTDATANGVSYALTGSDAFLCRLVLDDARPRERQLTYGTFIGGSAMEAGNVIATDRGGGVVLMGRTMSSDFPTSDGAVDRTYAGGEDVFVARFDWRTPEACFSVSPESRVGEVPIRVELNASCTATPSGSDPLEFASARSLRRERRRSAQNRSRTWSKTSIAAPARRCPEVSLTFAVDFSSRLLMECTAKSSGLRMAHRRARPSSCISRRDPQGLCHLLVPSLETGLYLPPTTDCRVAGFGSRLEQKSACQSPRGMLQSAPLLAIVLLLAVQHET